MLRDCQLDSFGGEALEQLAESIKDPNYRIFAEDGELHVVSANLHLSDTDPYRLFDRLVGGEDQSQPPTNIDPAHAFYLGYELAKAATALTLSKQYTQDESLNWGFLTSPEPAHRLARGPSSPRGD